MDRIPPSLPTLQSRGIAMQTIPMDRIPPAWRRLAVQEQASTAACHDRV